MSNSSYTVLETFNVPTNNSADRLFIWKNLSTKKTYYLQYLSWTASIIAWSILHPVYKANMTINCECKSGRFPAGLQVQEICLCDIISMRKYVNRLKFMPFMCPAWCSNNWRSVHIARSFPIETPAKILLLTIVNLLDIRRGQSWMGNKNRDILASQVTQFFHWTFPQKPKLWKIGSDSHFRQSTSILFYYSVLSMKYELDKQLHYKHSSNNHI